MAARAVAAGLPEETLLVTMQVFTEHLGRMAEHQRALFRRDIQDRLLATGMARAKMLETSAAIRERLVSLGYRASHLIHRRMLERQQFENTAEQLEILLHEIGIRRRPDPEPSAIVFVDLSGFHGAHRGGGRRARRRAQLGVRRGRPRGDERPPWKRQKAPGRRGDAAIRAGPRSPAAGASIGDGGRRPRPPTGTRRDRDGPPIRRDGDYFGHTVNLAARICDAAVPGTVTATLDVAGLTPDLRWIPLGRTSLKGVPDPVELVRPDAGA